MKKTAFLFLLSLSLCLSKPAEPQAGPPTQAATNALTQDPIKQKEQTTNPIHVGQASQNTTDETQKPAISLPKPSVTGSETQQPDATKVPIKADDTNKTSDKKEDKTEKTPASVTESTNAEKNATEAKAITDKTATNETTTAVTPKNVTTTPKSEATTKAPEAKSTEAPKTDADKHTLQARGFDGPSFIGGMVLTLGLLAVGFMGFKYYKNQTERNYHTL